MGMKSHDFEDFGGLMAQADKFDPLLRYEHFEYAIKYLFGVLEKSENKKKSLKKDDLKNMEARIRMLKMLLKTLVDARSFPFPTPKSQQAKHE